MGLAVEFDSTKGGNSKGGNIVQTFLHIIHVIVAVFMILVVLIQNGNSGGVGAAFGGGNSSSMFGAGGANSLLTKLTYGAAIIFMATSVALTVIQGRAGKTGLGERLKRQTEAAVTPAPLVPGTSPAAVAPAALPSSPPAAATPVKP